MSRKKILPSNACPMGFISICRIETKVDDKKGHQIVISELEHINLKDLERIIPYTITRYATKMVERQIDTGSYHNGQRMKTVMRPVTDDSKVLGVLNVLQCIEVDTTREQKYRHAFIHAVDLERYKAEIKRINALVDVSAITRRVLGE